MNIFARRRAGKPEYSVSISARRDSDGPRSLTSGGSVRFKRVIWNEFGRFIEKII